MGFGRVVEWDNKQGDIIYRYPEEAIVLGTTLIVKEFQEAVLLREGRALDSFGPGKYALKTGNMPQLEHELEVSHGTPLPAEIYFINKSEIPNLKWGTKHPVELIDPVYHLAIPVRAFGNYSIRVEDARSLLMMAIGTWSAYTTGQVGAALRDQIILPKFQDLISETMAKQGLSIFKLSAYLDEIGIAGRIKISEDFLSFGIELVRFAIESVNMPEDDPSVKRLKKALADKAEIGIIGEEDYKLKRTLDSIEKAALSGGGRLGTEFGRILPGILKGREQAEEEVECPKCKTLNRQGVNFCSNCGEKLTRRNACSVCGCLVPVEAKFCPECGENLQEQACPKCKTMFKPGTKFCPECGRKLR